MRICLAQSTIMQGHRAFLLYAVSVTITFIHYADRNEHARSLIDPLVNPALR